MVFRQFLQFVDALLLVVVTSENGVELGEGVLIFVDGPFQGIVLVDERLVVQLGLLEGGFAGDAAVVLIKDNLAVPRSQVHVLGEYVLVLDQDRRLLLALRLVLARAS